MSNPNTPAQSPANTPDGAKKASTPKNAPKPVATAPKPPQRSDGPKAEVAAAPTKTDQPNAASQAPNQSKGDVEGEVKSGGTPAAMPPPTESTKPPSKNMADLDVPVTEQSVPICPAVGTKLRCDAFEGDLSVMCIVESVREADGLFVVRIPALNDRRWPFSVDRLSGDALVYVAADYPPLGKSAQFDDKFRAHLKDRELTEREKTFLSKAGFTPPRKARSGYIWVMVAVGPVSGVAYNHEGKLVKGDHPLTKEPMAKYLEMSRATALPLIKENILLDCDAG